MATFNMQGKVALVTGASGGIGLSTARAFAEAGASVILSARRVDILNQEAQKLVDAGFNAIAIPADVTDEGQIEALVAQAVQHFGRLDYAVNNAGVISDRQPTHELSKKDWDKQIAVDLTAVWLCMKHELVQMVKQSSGAIVNLSSVSGLRGFPELAAYAAAKHGVVGLSKGAGVEYASRGIRVNAICPGWVETPMTKDFGSDEQNRKIMVESSPMHRTSTPEEIANTILWLCSDAASFITASAIAIDGGQTA